MKRLLSLPATNAVGISIFTAFYASIFIITSGRAGFREILFYNGRGDDVFAFWQKWSAFLAAGHHQYIAYALIGITALVVGLLLSRRRAYDEYHTSILTQCLVVAIALTLLAIGLFYLMMLCDPVGIVEKFTLFIAIHWTSVILADLFYILICRWG